MLGIDQTRESVARAADRTAAALDAYGPSVFALPTRCLGWNVSALAQHIVWGMTMQADALRRRRVGRPGLPDGADPGHVIAADDIRSAATLLDGELTAATSSGPPVRMPYGDFPLALVLQIIAMEAGVHADDVTAAIGSDEPLDPEVVVATTAFLEAFLPAMAIGALEQPQAGTSVALTGHTVDMQFTFMDGRWAADRTASVLGGIIGNDSAVLRYALGRSHLDGHLVAATGDPGVAQRFKLWFPGP